MINIFEKTIELLSDTNISIIIRGSLANSLHKDHTINKLNDIDILLKNHNDFGDLIAFLKKNYINFSFGEFIYHNERIPRKRIILEFDALNRIVLDILIYDNYYNKVKPLSKNSNVYLASKEDLLAENIISISQTKIGMSFENRIDKSFNIIQRINNQQLNVDPNSVLKSLLHILHIQNFFYNEMYSIFHILSGAHKYTKYVQKKYCIDNFMDYDIYSIILKLSKILFPFEDDDIVYFYSSNDRYGKFSNFSKHKIVYDEIEYPTSEHCYQAQKTTNYKLQNKIIGLASPKDAAVFGRNIIKDLREDWEFIRITIMYNIVKEKVLQNADVYILLISTENKAIIETSEKDSFWGIGKDKVGKNILGKILQSIRKEIV